MNTDNKNSKIESKMSADTIMTLGRVCLLLCFTIFFTIITVAIGRKLVNVRMLVLGIIGIGLLAAGIKLVGKAKKIKKYGSTAVSVPEQQNSAADSMPTVVGYFPDDNAEKPVPLYYAPMIYKNETIRQDGSNCDETDTEIHFSVGAGTLIMNKKPYRLAPYPAGYTTAGSASTQKMAIRMMRNPLGEEWIGIHERCEDIFKVFGNKIHIQVLTYEEAVSEMNATDVCKGIVINPLTPNPVAKAKNAAVNMKPQGDASKGEIDDLSYVKKMNMTKLGNWFMYDVALDARPLGWEQIVMVVDSIAKQDMVKVEKLEAGRMVGSPIDLKDEYEKSNHEIVNMPTLKQEASNLAIAGLSKRAGLVQVVLFNQTNIIKFMTIQENEDIIRRYAETIARKSFDTPDDMKLGRPHEE